MQFVRRAAKYRPLDITVALVVLVFGIGQVASPDEIYFPWVLDAISVYFIFGSVVTLVGILCPGALFPIQKFISEMFGWLFVASAATAMAIVYFVAVFNDTGPDLIRDMTWFWMWLVVAIGTTGRFFIMRSLYKRGDFSG